MENKEIILTKETGNKIINILYDDDCENIRITVDHSSIIYANDLRYSNRYYNDFDNYGLSELFEEFGIEANYMHSLLENEEFNKKYYWKCINYNRHSNIVLKVSETTDDFFADLFGLWTIEKTCISENDNIALMAEGEINDLEKYLNGEMYRYEIYNKDEHYLPSEYRNHFEPLEAIGSFTSIDSALDDAKYMIIL
jgi:hypothetical protein